VFSDLHEALRMLDQSERGIIGLRDRDALPHPEIAQTLQMKEGTVRSRYRRAREWLRRELADDSPSLEGR
jgi:RNA polymerase sigma-70 factor (ECF subfamily)